MESSVFEYKSFLRFVQIYSNTRPEGRKCAVNLTMFLLVFQNTFGLKNALFYVNVIEACVGCAVQCVTKLYIYVCPYFSLFFPTIAVWRQHNTEYRIWIQLFVQRIGIFRLPTQEAMYYSTHGKAYLMDRAVFSHRRHGCTALAERMCSPTQPGKSHILKYNLDPNITGSDGAIGQIRWAIQRKLPQYTTRIAYRIQFIH